MPLLAPTVDWAKAARAAVNTRGYAGPNGSTASTSLPTPTPRWQSPRAPPLPAFASRAPCSPPKSRLAPSPAGCSNPDVPILQVRLHADDVDKVIQACTGRADATVNKTQQRHWGTEGTTLLFAAHKPTTMKAVRDKYPFKHPNLDTLRYVVHSKPTMACATTPSAATPPTLRSRSSWGQLRWC